MKEFYERRVYPCHGGKNINSASSLHLCPITLGYFKDLFSKEYFMKMMGEDNAFSCTLEERERYTYNRGKKR